MSTATAVLGLEQWPHGTNKLARDFDMPDAAKVKAAADKLAADFNIADVEGLCSAIAYGLAVANQVKRGLALIFTGKTFVFVYRADLDRHNQFLATLTSMRKELPDIPFNEDDVAANRLASAIDNYIDEHSGLVGGPAPRKTKSVTCGLVVHLADSWPLLTGEKLDKPHMHKGSRRGRFDAFAKAACEALGFKAPNPLTIRGWLIEAGLLEIGETKEAE